MWKSKPLTPAQQRNKVAQALANEKAFIAECAGETNPQVIEMRNRAQGRADALEAVLCMFNADNCLINIMSEQRAS